MKNGKDFIRIMSCLLGLQLAKVDAIPSNLESMTVSRMKMEDLETSASGYSYHQQHGVPASYVHYDNQGSRHYFNAPAPVNYVAAAAPGPDAVAAPLAYGSPKAVLQFDPVQVQYVKQVPDNYEAGLPAGYVVPLLSQHKQPLAPYYTVPAVKVEQVPEKIEIVDDEEDDEEDDHEHDDDDDDDDDEDDDEHASEPREFDFDSQSYGHGFVEPAKTVKAYEKGGGAAHAAEEHSEQGEKGDKAYKKYHGFDNGEKAEHESENQKGHHSENSGHKKLHGETSGHYAGHAEGSKGEAGASYGTAKSHKKGHKTTGFHNVYHKDEYKKDTDFYDDAHNSGKFEKQGAFGSEHASNEGGYKRGGHHDSAYAEDEAGKEGKFDKGHENQEAEGHKAAEGSEIYHENHADYAAKGASSEGKAHGYSKGHQQPRKYSS